MAKATQPPRDEHRELLPHIEELRVAADAVGETSYKDLQTMVAKAHDFLTHNLIPHAERAPKATPCTPWWKGSWEYYTPPAPYPATTSKSAS